ncbi:hypothetical protein K402DRAFT_392245 [Aulographum hederae CBS 113979]|uniref:Extracellular membrane protein CFEM domain-containing protein n=1 Tax=Aulographum hederae CBS 113979 TaxID=1176131 RepID=A0A6G1H4H1_9PEZI|nr:hypothetical protein K402DRAFT_392245 [Aulographum hederae CBS 113979]
MFSKTALLFAGLAVSRLALAQSPPACLLGALNTQPNPADTEAICGNASEVQEAIASMCGANTNAAMSAFASTCSADGVSVSSYVGSASATGSKSASHSASHSASRTASGSASGSASASASATHHSSASDSEVFSNHVSHNSTVSMPLSTGMLTATGTGAVPTGAAGETNGTLVVGSPTATGSSTGSSPLPSNAAGQAHVGPFVAAALAAAGLAILA